MVGQGRRSLLVAPVLSAVAAAQSGSGQPGGGRAASTFPTTSQFVGKQDPGVRKATAIVNGEVITGSDIDQRLALIVASQPASSSRPRRSSGSAPRCCAT